MSLRDHLRIPYLVEAALVTDEGGGWLREAAHPELPDCVARSPDIVRTLDMLERRRVEVIVALLKGGTPPPPPRPPLAHADPEGALHRHGLHRAFGPLLDLPASAIAMEGNADVVA